MGTHDDYYLKDPRAKTIEGFRVALDILAKYAKDGEKTSYFCHAEHDILYTGPSLKDVPEDSEEGKTLTGLGFHVNEDDTDMDNDCWAYFC